MLSLLDAGWWERQGGGQLVLRLLPALESVVRRVYA